jgi:N4-gp56 family major capsid protein
MAQAVNSTTSLTSEMQIFYNKVFLERAQLETTYDFLTEKEDFQKNSGKVMYFTRTTAFTPTTAALTEGTTPTGIAFTSSTIVATVGIYGDTTQPSTFFELTGIDSGLKEKVSTFGQYAAEKMDTIRLYTMVAGATPKFANAVLYSAVGTGATGDPFTALQSTDTLDVADLRLTALTLKTNKAPKFEAPVGSLNKGGAYRGVVSSQGYYELLGDNTTGAFTSINLAVSSSETGQIKDQAIKRIAGFDLMESNNQYTRTAGAGTVTAYANLFCGKGAVKEVAIGSSNPRIIYKRPGDADTSNPLDMYSTLSWKVDAWTCIVANSSWIINLYCA